MKALKGKNMNNKQLARSLQTVGMRCFVNYFEDFNDLNKTQDALIKMLIEKESYEESGSRARVNAARRIIREGRAKDALLLVMVSGIPEETREKAKKLAKIH
jgi:hypothetical protein